MGELREFGELLPPLLYGYFKASFGPGGEDSPNSPNSPCRVASSGLANGRGEHWRTSGLRRMAHAGSPATSRVGPCLMRRQMRDNQLCNLTGLQAAATGLLPANRRSAAPAAHSNWAAE
jgi:hypothetical protein